MRNLLVTIAYDGSAYHGWQVQKNAVTVQEVFQNALERLIGERPDVKGCSRTDSGVHARAYCISFKTESSIPCRNIVSGLNTYLPRDIAVLSCSEAGDDALELIERDDAVIHTPSSSDREGTSSRL